MILVDANIWAYTLDEDADEHPRAADVTDRIVALDEVLMPTVVELEVVHYVHRTAGENAEPILADWFAIPRRTRMLGPHEVRHASAQMRMHRGDGIGGRDAVILVHAMQDRALLVTNDGRLLEAARGRGLAAWNPITEDDEVLDTWKPRPEHQVRERPRPSPRQRVRQARSKR